MTESQPSPHELVAAHLREQGVAFELVEHERRDTAATEAAAAGVEARDAAKSVVLRDESGYRLAVIPASERLDLHKVRDLLGAGSELGLASEEQLAADFPQFELGAVPPLGEMLPAPELIDSRLLEHERVLCNGGDHAHSFLIAPADLVRVADARVAGICQD